MAKHRASSLLQEEKRRSSVLSYEDEGKLRLGAEVGEGQAARLRKGEESTLERKSGGIREESGSRKGPHRLLERDKTKAMRAGAAAKAASDEMGDAVDAEGGEEPQTRSSGVVQRLAAARRGDRREIGQMGDARRKTPVRAPGRRAGRARVPFRPSETKGAQGGRAAYRAAAAREARFQAGAQAAAAKGAAGKAAAVGAGASPVTGAVLAIAAVAGMAVLLLGLLVAMGSFLAMQEKSYGAGDMSGLPGWVTAEFVEECLYIQEKYGLSAAVAIAQAQLETGGCWNGVNFTYNGQPYDLVNVAHNHFCATRGGSDGNRWAEERNEVTYNGEPFLSPFSPGFVWRKYSSAKQAIHDRARILLHEGYYAGVREAAFKSTEKQAEALSQSPWCEGGYGGLMGYVNQYNLKRFDGMTVAQWRASGSGGEIVSLTGGRLGNPLSGQQWTMSSGFGYRSFDNAYHKGIDMAAAEGTPYYAAESGTVLYATNDGGYNGGAGNWVVIDHGGGLVTKYMHSSATFVVPGQQVKKGQHIGNVGNTGDSYGAHLHFQVEQDGRAVDPLPLIGG